ncbi:unnamed protein product [Hyaloperonospora brassicae]|uniref:Uncharacterized protein n=1 Tax=Hyaloperonospora brassicae TaxID=162125 RepID=A0AAV0UCG9_HYABA|nr:unnamed protein product [Hyaloperonospora brassicae]
MEAQHKRVEQKGRFTITEIVPVSSFSAQRSSSPFQDTESSAKAPSSNRVATLSPCQATVHDTCVTTTTVRTKDLKWDELFGCSQTQEAETVVTVPVESHRTLASETEAVTIDVASKRSFSTTGLSAPGSPSRKFSALKKNRDGVQRAARRIKRRGRFTIIEMASDSPSSRKNSDELCDHRLPEGSSGRLAPQHHSCSFEPVERRAKSKRVPRSMPRLRQLSSYRRSRRRSESPSTDSVDAVRTTPGQRQLQETTAYAKRPTLPVAESIDALAKVSLSGVVASRTGAAAISSSSAPVSMASVAIPDSGETATIPSSAVRSATSSPQPIEGSAMNDSTGPSQTSPLAISAAQFLQQQRMIASLIRQQHDLKQIIGVLREQQQQLITIPLQMSELDGQRVSCDGRTKEEETRALYTRLDSLTRSNKSLHSLLDVAEREVRHRTLQVECLSEENDELRHHCGQLELFLQDRRAKD